MEHQHTFSQDTQGDARCTKCGKRVHATEIKRLEIARRRAEFEAKRAQDKQKALQEANGPSV